MSTNATPPAAPLPATPPSTPTPASAPAAGRPAARYLDILSVFFVVFLLVSNIAATKLIGIDVGPWTLIFDGGALLFPLSYIVGDILSEVYGFRRARRVIAMGFAASILASVVFLLVQIAPPAASYENQAAFEAVLGFVPRIVVASLAGYTIGQLLNSHVLVSIKRRWGARHLWARLVGSTLVGELADTVIFCTIAYFGVLTGLDFLNYVLTGYVYKTLVEIILLPLTYLIIGWVKRHESVAPWGEAPGETPGQAPGEAAGEAAASAGSPSAPVAP